MVLVVGTWCSANIGVGTFLLWVVRVCQSLDPVLDGELAVIDLDGCGMH